MLKSGCFSLIIWVKQCKQGCSWKPTVFIFLIFYIKMQHLGKICQKDVYHHRNGTFVKILWTSAPIIHYNQQEASFSKHSSLNWAPGQTTATTGPSTPPHRTKWSQTPTALHQVKTLLHNTSRSPVILQHQTTNISNPEKELSAGAWVETEADQSWRNSQRFHASKHQFSIKKCKKCRSRS